MYDLETGVTGKPTVINRIAVKEKMKTVSNVIQFRVFCAAYCRAYVGNVGIDEESERAIIESIQRALRHIQTRFKDTTTGEWRTITHISAIDLLSI